MTSADLEANSVETACRDFESALRSAVAISERAIGQTHTGRQRRALAVFNKMILHNMAITVVSDKYLENTLEGILDHFSLATLGRASLDAGLMTMYLSEPSISLTRWDFRRQLLFLHDLNNRSLFLKPFQKVAQTVPFFENAESVRMDIRDKIANLGAALLYSENKIVEYQSGQLLFVDGARGAVREAGWDVDQYDHLQSYLSAFVHSHPVSFMRFDEHDIRFGGASQFQMDFTSSLLGALADYMRSVVARMDIFSVPEAGDPNGQLD